MKRKNKIILSLIGISIGLFLSLGKIDAARYDMVDVSNHNGSITTNQFVNIRNQYGVKAVTTKLSEGTTYHDWTARSNIANAQAAGLFINGYHFARYYDVNSARNEAVWAVQCAKQDGLPIGAVLVSDVEASEQRGISKATLNAANAEFKRIVEEAGYRYDVYTMGSWVWSKMGVYGGWIAQYPYNVSIDKWTGNNAWQWSSTARLSGISGYLDVSQLYTDYYTGNLDKNAVISNAQTAQVDTKTEAKHDTASDEDYSQRGIFRVKTVLNIRNAPSLSGSVAGTYYPGETLIYDHVYIKDGYAWAGYTSWSGRRHYVAMGVMGGQEYGTRTTGRRTYTVRYGDTLAVIANRLGVNVYTLARNNGIGNINLIYSGQQLSY